MTKFASLLGLAPLVMFFLPACGNYQDREHKDYRIYIDSTDKNLVEKTRLLIADYNAEVGFEALKIAGERDDHTSELRFTRGLHQSTGKIGFGQAQMQPDSEPQYRQVEMRKLKRNNYYSMNIEFDQDYFMTRLNAAESTEAGMQLKVLFAHEVGHGYFFGHAADDQAVMYHAVLGRADTDFPEYYSAVSQFFRE